MALKPTSISAYSFGFSFPYFIVRVNYFGKDYVSSSLYFIGIADVFLNRNWRFIDWFSTGYIKYNEDKFDEIVEYINTIIHKLE